MENSNDQNYNFRKSAFETKINHETFFNMNLKTRLTLRKAKIAQDIMSKRCIDNQIDDHEYKIDITTLDCSPELKENAKAYISSSFEVKSIWKSLFSGNLNSIKVSLCLLRKYIIFQLTSRAVQDRFLSRNDVELINLLCKFLIFPDKQINYESAWCWINIVNLPEKIENKIYTKLENLDFIYNFLINSDIKMSSISCHLASNICSKSYDVTEKYLTCGIMEKLNCLWNNDHCIGIFRQNVLKLIYALARRTKEFPQDLDFFIKILPSWTNLFKSITKTCWDSLVTLIIYFNIWYFLTLHENITIYKLILTSEYIEKVINFYYSINTTSEYFEIQFLIIQWFGNLLYTNEFMTQVMVIDGNITDLLKQALLQYKDNNPKNILTEILFAIGNIAGGTWSYIEGIRNNGWYIDLLDLTNGWYNDIRTGNNRYNKIQLTFSLFKDSVYALLSMIHGGSEGVQMDIYNYNEHVILDFILYSIQMDQCLNDNWFIYNALKSLYKLIVLSENMMCDEVLKEWWVRKGVPELLEKESFVKRLNATNKLLVDDWLLGMKMDY